MSQEPTKESSKSMMTTNSKPNQPLSPLAQVLMNNQLKTFYSTTSSSRLRVVTSAFMSQNHMLAREINKNYKKLHFKAA